MSVIKKLGWFFKLERKRYIIGIFALMLVSLFNLIPPMMIGNVVDSIAKGNLETPELFKNVGILLFAAFAMYVLRFVWRQFIIGTSNKLGRLLRTRLFEHFTKMPPSFFQKHRTGDLMAHATNDVRVVNMLAGPGVMSAVDASVTALVTLTTTFCYRLIITIGQFRNKLIGINEFSCFYHRFTTDILIQFNVICNCPME